MTPGEKIILNFIGQAESGMNYDSVFGNHPTPKPVTQMTLSELMSLQAVWGKKYGSSAAGYLQFMRATLAGLIAAKKATPSAVFSRDLQDQLGLALLAQCGSAKFFAKSISLETFARKLAQEWASMPVLVATQGAHRRVAAGETYYAGDRLNRALVSPETFRGMLLRAKAATS